MHNRKIILITIFIAAIVCSILYYTINKIDTNIPAHKILVIHSYEESFSGYDDFNKLISREFGKRRKKVEVTPIFLHGESYDRTTEIDALNALLLSLGDYKPDIILINDDQALRAALRSTHPMLLESQIVFAGVSYPRWPLLVRHGNITGTIDKLDFKRNYDFADLVLDYRCYLYMGLDSTYIDRKIYEDVQQQSSEYHIPIDDIKYSESLDIRDDTKYIQEVFASSYNHPYSTIMLIRLRNTNIGHFIYRLYNFSPNYHELQVKRDFMSVASQKLSKTAIFTATYEGFGYNDNILGGYFTPMDIIAEEMVDRACRILDGEPAFKIPITESRKEFLINWQAAKKWNVDISSLDPKKYHVINRPFYDQYRIELWVCSILIILFIIFIITRLLLLYSKEHKQRHKALVELQTEKELLAQSVKKLKEREHELIVMRDLAEKAELKQSFLANMSHEIRTPLNAIVGFANIIASDDGKTFDEQERKTFIDTMNQNCELLLNLIGDILEISRIESGNISMSFKKQNVNDMLKELYNTYQLLVKPDIDLKLDLYPEPLWANIDKHRFSQVIINFLSNANKFTDVGYIKLGSQFDVESGEITVYVEDTGKGIPKEEQKMIFERFYKRDEFAQGTGLGLSICKSIAEKHCGRIELHSELGKGSRFELILPAITDLIKTN